MRAVAGVEASERAVLRLCLSDPEVVDEVMSLGVTVNHFYNHLHRMVWEASVSDRQRGVGPDEATLFERAEVDKRFSEYPGVFDHLSQITRTSARRMHLGQYLLNMDNARRRRRFVRMAREVIDLYEQNEPADSMAKVSHQGVLEAESFRGTAQENVPISEVLSGSIDRAVKVARGEIKDERLRTGIGALDRTLRLRPGDFCILAARPSMGKTQLALDLLASIARHECPALLISAEMTLKAVGERLVTSDATDEGPDALERAAQGVAKKWKGVPLLINDQTRSLAEVVSAIRVAYQKDGVRVVAVDYLQLLDLPKEDTREQTVANASRVLKGLCSQLGILLILLSQLNRGVEQRPDKRPLMSDLRDSGQLEQDADHVVFVYREVQYRPNVDNPEEAELLISKQRNGPTGTVFVDFRKPAEPGEPWFVEKGR